MPLNSNALITVADLRSYMALASSDSDDLIEVIINGVSTEFDRFVGRTLKQTAYTNLYLDGNGETILDFPNWPAATVTGVYENDVLLTAGDDYDYIVVSSDDDAYLQKLSASWIEVDDAVSGWYEGTRTVKVSSCLLGYATIPADLALACLKQSALEFQRMKKKEWGETSRSVGDGSVSLLDPGLLPDVVAVLKRYRRYKV